MGANDPWGVDSLGPWSLIGRIYVGDHKTLLHTKYVSCGPYGFRERDFLRVFFSIISLWMLIIPGAWPVWTTRA